jgi:hypothetical protein
VAEEPVRTPIPDCVAAEVLYQHDRICCVCNEPGKAIQIHHIDENPSNHSLENLAVLCLQHHEETHLHGGFGRKLRAVDVMKHREEWTRRVGERRALVDKLVVEKMATVSAKAERRPFRYRPSAKLLKLYLDNIPDIIGDTYAKAEEIVRDGDSKDAVAAARLVIGVLEQILVQLSKWVDPHHFEGKPPRDYYSEFLAERNRWNRLLIEPKDYGTRARTGTVETLESTVVDLRYAINSLVVPLSKAYLQDFNYPEWAGKLPKSILLWTKEI